jgi:DNA recombination protein RmuC
MNTLLIIIAIVTFVFVLFSFLIFWKKVITKQSQELQNFKTLQEQITKLERTLFDTTNQLHGHQKEISSHLLNQHSQSNKIFGEVQTSLGKVHQLTSQFSHIGQELSSLQKLFDVPKRRGIFGEELLKKLLAEILPTERFALQHRIGPDCIVDAAILFSEKNALCIDAKFPMPTYQAFLNTKDAEKTAHLKLLSREVKRHVNAIATRYVRPDLGTLPFALMYIPAESIYYDLFVTQIDSELDQPAKMYAFERKVYPVSPNTLYMFLQQICTTFKHEVSSQRAWEILDRVSALTTHLQKMSDHNEGIKRYLDYAQKRVNDMDGTLNRFKRDMDKIEAYRSQPELERPKQKNKDNLEGI